MSLIIISTIALIGVPAGVLAAMVDGDTLVQRRKRRNGASDIDRLRSLGA